MDNFYNLDMSQNHEIRFRCPSCEKLYRTQSDVFADAQPEFDCQSCSKSFLLTSNTDSFGLYQTKMREHTFESCPKCTHLMPENAKECPSCGIFVEKYKKIAQAESPTLFEINQLWDAVINDFNSDKNHQNFLNFCQRKMALSFAFQKYDSLRKSMSYDAHCEKYLKQIEIRLEQQFIAKSREDLTPPPREEKSMVWQWIFASIGFVGLALLTYNKIRPTFPNLTGLVVSITLLAFGLWIFSAQRKHMKLPP